jgi:UDP-N-acetylmuramyl pentapeptide phosphotransferase/UDP-N-acetylglucosamine-1-phosphate transferase
LAFISFIDDLKPLGPAKRFSFHFTVAALALFTLKMSGLRLALGPDTGLILPNAASWVIAILFIAGYTNAFNFMDGINGIAAGQAVITGIGMALLVASKTGDFSSTPVIVSFLVAGASLGFLPHNFPGARMFMGDVGSAPLGFLLSTLCLWLSISAGWWLLIPMALLHANFILDTGITLLRRILRGERWYDAHREHFYQRLIRSGKSHLFVTCLEMALQCFSLVLMLVYVSASPLARIGLIFTVLAVWLLFFAYCEAVFRRSLKMQHQGEPDTRMRGPELTEQPR